MPNYKCECPMVFGGDDAQRDRDIHMDSCEFRKIRIERDALLLQIDELKAENTRLFKSFNEYGKKVEAENAMLKQLNDDLCTRVEELKKEDEHQDRLNRDYKAALEKIRDYIDTPYPMLSRTQEIAKAALVEKRNHDHARGVCDEKTCSECAAFREQEKRVADVPKCVTGGKPGPNGGWIGGVWSHNFVQVCLTCGGRLQS